MPINLMYFPTNFIIYRKFYDSCKELRYPSEKQFRFSRFRKFPCISIYIFEKKGIYRLNAICDLI